VSGLASEFFNTIGHNRPVEAVIQYRYWRLRRTSLNIRNSTSKLTLSLPRPGHSPPVESAIQFQ